MIVTSYRALTVLYRQFEVWISCFHMCKYSSYNDIQSTFELCDINWGMWFLPPFEWKRHLTCDTPNCFLPPPYAFTSTSYFNRCQWWVVSKLQRSGYFLYRCLVNGSSSSWAIGEYEFTMHIEVSMDRDNTSTDWWFRSNFHYWVLEKWVFKNAWKLLGFIRRCI